MNYFDVFKKWYFWLIVVVYAILSFISGAYQEMTLYGTRLFLSEYIALMIASIFISFCVCLIFYSIGWVVYRVVRKIFK